MKKRIESSNAGKKFPLLAVENDCIVSKDADITVGFRLELPEIFSVTSAEYENIHSTG